MEVAIRANRVSMGGIRRRFAALGRRLVWRKTGIVQAASEAGQGRDTVAARRRLEQKVFGAIGLGGRGLFS